MHSTGISVQAHSVSCRGVQVQGSAGAEGGVARMAPRGVRGVASCCAAPAADDHPASGAHPVAARQVLPGPARTVLRSGRPGSSFGIGYAAADVR